MNNKKTVVALLLVATIGIVGLTIAYFANSTSVDNTFITKEYGTTYEETFVSPDNWLPGDTTPKTLVATNTGEVDQAVRVLVTESWTTNNNGTLNGWIHADGTKSTHTTQSELETDERVAILNLANTSDWTKVGNYYYYNYKLAPTESTSSLLEAVTFNPKTKLDDTCTETVNNGTRTITCNSSGNDYDNATYTLTLTIETVQYNKYATAWSTGNTVNILEERQKFVDFLIENRTNSSNSIYDESTKTNMFIFNQPITDQTPAQTDYRYIGDDPNNYVYFNCDDMANQSSSTCEVWRILGVFDVDDGNSNYELRVKLLRGNSFYSNMSELGLDSNINNWEVNQLSIFLNEDYYKRIYNATSFGIKPSARNMIDDAKYYLGGGYYKDNTFRYGSTEEIYAWERGTDVYNKDTYCQDHSGYYECYSETYCEDNPNSDICLYPTRPIYWIGKIGLMYLSDNYYTYAKEVNNNCYNYPYECSLNGYGDNPGVPSSGWIFNSNKKENKDNISTTLVINPSSKSGNSIFIIHQSGSPGGVNVPYYDGIRPVLYLKSSVKYVSGDGTSGNPYKLSL